MIMKKVFNSFFVIIAAMVTFAGCAKQEIDAPATPETKTVQFFANSIETKTAFGTPDGTTYPTLWNVGDKVKVLLNIEQVAGTEKIADVECEADLAESARFEVAFAPNTAPESYTYYAVCPSSAYNAKSSADGRITVIIPTDQTPLETTVDKDAQIIYAVAPADADQTSVDMDFHHLTSYGKFSLVNLTSEVSSVSQVKIVAPEDLYISGKWNYLVENGTISVHTKDMSNEITITTTQTDNIWFSCGPVDVSGKTFKFIVTTDKGDLEKTVTFPTGSKFESGKIKKFSLDMTDLSVDTPETPDTPENPEVTTQYYEKVTSAPADWSGTYLIVFETQNYCWDGSLEGGTSTGQFGHAAGHKSVTIKDNRIEYNDSYFTIAKSGTNYSITSASGSCVGNSGTSAGLKIGGYTCSISLNDDKTVNIISSDGNTQVLYNISASYIRFYKTSNAGSNSYGMPSLYKLIGDENDGETPAEKTLVSIAVSNPKIEYTVGDEFVEPTVTATYSDGSTEDVTASAEFKGYNMSAADTYTVTVSYSDKTTTYSIKVSAAQSGGDVADPVTVIATIGDLGWDDATKYTTLTLDDVITATASSGTNTGKYYKSDLTWRFYANESAELTIKAEDGYIIKTVKLTYTIKDNGTLNSGSDALSSDMTYDVNSASVTYTVGSSSGSKGKVFIKKIEVVYQAN